LRQSAGRARQGGVLRETGKCLVTCVVNVNVSERWDQLNEISVRVPMCTARIPPDQLSGVGGEEGKRESGSRLMAPQ
jgi:hypothetical protein